MNYCGMCGYSLDEQALRAGRCPRCGVPFDIPNDELGPSMASLSDMPTQPVGMHAQLSARSPAYAAAAYGAADVHDRGGETSPVQQEAPILAGGGPTRGRRRRRRGRSRRVAAIWQFAFLALVALLVTDVAIYALTQRNPISIALAPFTSSNASTSVNVSTNSSSGGVSTVGSTSANTVVPSAHSSP